MWQGCEWRQITVIKDTKEKNATKKHMQVPMNKA